jgi:hypothetical protein
VSEYGFTLRFTLASAEDDLDDLVERLGDGGCDDALVGIGHPGRIALDFIRNADSAPEAVFSAVADVSRALPGATLAEVAPDLVGITDVAEMVGCSRQNIRQMMIAAGSGALVPVHEGSPSVWHLAPVLSWLALTKGYRFEQSLLDVASIAMQVNLAIDARSADSVVQERIRTLIA